MSSYVETIEQVILSQPENRIIIASRLYAYISRLVPEMTYYKTLERMTKTGKLEHLTKGLYYRPRMTEYGVIPLGERTIIDFYSGGTKGIVVGASLYNSKGISTQIGKRVEILSTVLTEQKKNIRNVSISRIDLRISKNVSETIEVLEILQNYYSIEDLNKGALVRFLETYGSNYSEKTVEYVLKNRKYKKSTIAFLAAIMNHMGIENTLKKHLSGLSVYSIPTMRELYETA